MKSHERTTDEIIREMLKRYDEIVIKKVNGEIQFVGVSRQIEAKVPLNKN